MNSVNNELLKKIIKKHTIKIARLQAQQKKLIKNFFVTADKYKTEEIKDKIKSSL